MRIHSGRAASSFRDYDRNVSSSFLQVPPFRPPSGAPRSFSSYSLYLSPKAQIAPVSSLIRKMRGGKNTLYGSVHRRVEILVGPLHAAHANAENETEESYQRTAQSPERACRFSSIKPIELQHYRDPINRANIQRPTCVESRPRGLYVIRSRFNIITFKRRDGTLYFRPKRAVFVYRK